MGLVRRSRKRRNPTRASFASRSVPRGRDGPARQALRPCRAAGRCDRPTPSRSGSTARRRCIDFAPTPLSQALWASKTPSSAVCSSPTTRSFSCSRASVPPASECAGRHPSASPDRDDAHRQKHAFTGCFWASLIRTLPEGSSPGKNGFAGQESIQVFSQGERVGVALARVSGEALQADRLQIEGEFRAEPGRRDRVFFQDELERFRLASHP